MMQVCTMASARRCRPPRATLDSVPHHEKDVLDATVAQVGEHAHPELRTLTTGAGHSPRMSRSPAKLTPIAA